MIPETTINSSSNIDLKGWSGKLTGIKTREMANFFQKSKRRCL